MSDCDIHVFDFRNELSKLNLIWLTNFLNNKNDKNQGLGMLFLPRLSTQTSTFWNT